MPGTCPNKNLNEWKALERTFGYGLAMRLYERNGEQIPTVEEAKDMLNYPQANPAKPSSGPLKPISINTAKYLQNIFGAVFPGIKPNFISAQDFADKFGTDKIGAVGPDGKVYINTGRMNASTQIHELGHVWGSWAKRYNPKLYQQGLALAAQDGMLIERIKQVYPNLKGDALLEEALMTMIGEKGAEQIDESIDQEGNIKVSVQVFDYLQRLWSNIKNFVRKNFNIQLQEDFQAQSVSDFAKSISARLLSGNYISDITSEEVSDIEGDLGLTRAQIYHDTYNDSYFRNDFQAPVQPIYKPSWLDAEARAKGDLLTKFSFEINNAASQMTVKQFSEFKVGARYMRNYFEPVFDSITAMANSRQNANGENPANKSFTTNLERARKQMASGSMDEELQEIADMLLSGNFDRSALGPQAKAMWNDLIKHLEQQQYLAANQGAVFVSSNEKIEAAEQQAYAAAEILPWRSKLNALKEKNPYLKTTIEFMEKYVRAVAAGPLWTKMMTGKQEGMLWQLGKGIQRAVGKQAVVENNANHHLRKLYEMDWLKNGSQTLNPNSKLSELETEEYSGIKLTTEEQFNIFMVLQQDNVRARLLDGVDGNKAKFYLQEFGDERAGQEIEIGYDEYKRMQDKFDPFWEDVRSTWGNASDYIYGEVNEAFKLENGVDLGRAVNHEDGERWNIYFPLVSGKGKDAIQNFLKSNNFVNDISSHKYRDPSGEEVYYAGNALAIMNSYVKDNAQYAAFAIPVRNMNNFLKNNEKMLVDLGMKDYIEWWHKTERHMFDAGEDQLGEVGRKIINGFIISRLGLNPFVDLKQFSSVPLATTTIPAKYILKAQGDLFGTLTAEMKNYDIFSDWIGRDKQTVALLEEMKDHSNFALARIEGGTSEIQKFMQQGYLKKMKIPFLQDKNLQSSDFIKNIKTMDTAVGAMIWSASKMYVQNEMGISEGNPEYWQMVDDTYTQAVTESQSSIDEWNRPYFAKDGKMLNKALSLFAGQSFATFNGYLSRLIDYINNPNPRTLGKMTLSFMNVFVLSALMAASVDVLRYSLMNGGGDDEEDKNIFGQALLRSSYQNLPIVSPIIETVMSKYQSPVWGRELSYPIFEVVNNGATAVAQAMRGNEDKAIKEMTYFGAGLMGIPVTPIRTVEKVL